MEEVSSALEKVEKGLQEALNVRVAPGKVQEQLLVHLRPLLGFFLGVRHGVRLL